MRSPMAVVLLSATALLAGCSSSGQRSMSSTSAAQPPVSSHLTDLASQVTGLCPGHPEEMISDGLPASESGTSNRGNVEAVLEAHEDEIRSAYAQVARFEVGPGFGAAWERDDSGEVLVRQVDDYAMIARVHSRDGCPSGSRLHSSYGGVPVLFAVATSFKAGARLLVTSRHERIATRPLPTSQDR